MKKEDFIEHREEYLDACKTFIRTLGACARAHSISKLSCPDCPFYIDNAGNGKGCISNHYTGIDHPIIPSELLANSAKQYLKLYTDELKPNTIDDSLIYDRNIIVVE